MAGWFNRQWQDVKGNAKWSLVNLIGGYLLKPFMVPVVSSLVALYVWLKHLPTATDSLILIPAAFWIMGSLHAGWQLRYRPNKYLRLIPHGEGDSMATLEVQNLSKTRFLVSAQARVIDVNTPNRHRTAPFDLRWSGESKKEVFLEGGKSKVLKVLVVEPAKMTGDVSTMSFCNSDEKSYWAAFVPQFGKPPAYKVTITVFRRGLKAVAKPYSVGVKGFDGPIFMEELPE